MVARTHEGLIESISQMTAKNIIGNPQVSLNTGVFSDPSGNDIVLFEA